MSQQFRFFSVRLSVVVFALSLCFGTGFAQAEEFTNFLSMKFVDVPAGNFKMGAESNEMDIGQNELPKHEVSVKSFPLSKTEVTLGQFKRYIIHADRTDIVTDEFMNANGRGNDAPVVYVSWNDIKDFLIWINENKPASDKGTYRLPNEAEWEYACHAGTYDLYCGGRSPSLVAWHLSISGYHQQEVGRKAANAFGLNDMSGNVSEWVEDCYHDSYQNAPRDGTAWLDDCPGGERVLRGGSWKTDFHKVRATIRSRASSVTRSVDAGFRLVRQL